MGQKKYIFRYRTDIRDEVARPEPARPIPNRPGLTRTDPAWPWRSLTAYFTNMLKDTSLKLLHIIVTGLKIFVSYFHRDFFISFKVVAFFPEDGFLPFLHTFLRITKETLITFKI